ncbi:hypothetical protein [Stackebrandtia nassauensis]|uniref:DUF1877 family protein n=1 Tax=Stackebrandtia nassauensis (strain DSM 44728 / CIP 108903 / NRRL B-16338 / NBRC 102104 / LLR-40K-21) TaxID=446470 RepID=D3PXQ1_STANL|nr:hypothetical protein [Stackebrandtia nassauensis]ADD43381.1 hypothetical protein Snas_3724 [Stackebrandtia nassauensis DSM 44728]
MGVLTDYFRAADAADVVRAMRTEDGDPLVNGEHAVFEGVEAKGVDAPIVLGALIAAIRQVPWSADLVAETMVWPTTPMPGPDGPAAEDDPWATGPWVSRLDPAVRDTLADALDAALPDTVARWARTEELYGASAEDLLPVAQSLVTLARRARDDDQQLYCWVCL